MISLSTLLVSSVFIFNVSQHKYLALTDGKPTLSDTPVSLTLQEQDPATGRYSIAGSNGWSLVPTSDDTYAVGRIDAGANADQFVYPSTGESDRLATTPSLPAVSFEPAQWMILQTGDNVTPQAVTLDEATTSYTKPSLRKALVDVTLLRKFNAGRWNSFCLPFDLSADEVARIWGTEAKVAELKNVSDHDDGIVVSFDLTDDGIKGGQPCLLFLPEAYANADNTYTLAAIDATTWQRTTAPTTVERQGVAYAGSYVKTMVPYGSYVFTGDDKLHHVETTTLPMKGYRAYLIVGDGTEASAKPLTFSVDGDTPTDIDGLPAPMATAPVDIYHIDGTLVRRHATSTRGLAPGVYLMGGKKTVVK